MAMELENLKPLFISTQLEFGLAGLEHVMRIMKLAKYRLKAQVEKDEGPEAETLSRQLIVAEGPN